MRKRDYFNIPNMMGYFRILMLPVFMIFYLRVERIGDRYYFIALIALLLSILSDLFDGKIARKFDMVTDWGKMLDPIADKLTQGVLAITLGIRITEKIGYPLMWIFLGIFLIKELYQGLMGLYIIKKKNFVQAAKWFGKFSTGGIDMTFFALLLFPNIPNHVVSILCWMIILVILYAFFCYGLYHIGILNDKPTWKQQVKIQIGVGAVFILIHIAIMVYIILRFYSVI